MDSSPLLDRHLAAGARLAARPEAPLCTAPLLFGDVPGEYRAARSACVLFDACDRGRVTVTGRDGAEFLQRLLANHVKSVPVGGGDENLLLSPKGKVEFAFDLARFAQRFELSTPPGRGAELRSALARYHFAERLELADSGAAHAPLELFGPHAAEVVARIAGAALALVPHATAELAWQDAALVVRALAHGAWRLDAGPARAAALWDALVAAGARPSGLVVRDMLRVEAGRALPGVDVDPNVYPQEAGLLEAFALDKGCYVGQEVVAKIDTYGGLNKRLLTLRVEHSDPVQRGTRLMRAEDGESRELGLVTSWVYSFALDAGLVLAYVKRRHQELGTEFELEPGGARATIVAPPVP